MVVVSHDCWQKHFGAKADMAGASLVVDGVPREVVGVTPPDFHFIYDVDVWFPLRPGNLGPRRFNNWYILGRLADGVPLAQAQSDVDVIAAQLEKAYPDTNKDKGLLLTRLQGAFTEQYRAGFRPAGLRRRSDPSDRLRERRGVAPGARAQDATENWRCVRRWALRAGG